MILTNGKASTPTKINHGVRQSCCLTPKLFDLSIDDLIEKWKNHFPRGINLEHNRFLNTIFYEDNQAVIATTEDSTNGVLSKEYNCRISKAKIK